MRAAVLRNLRCQGRWIAGYLGFAAVMAAGFGGFSALTAPIAEMQAMLAGSLPAYLLAFGLMFQCMGGLTFYQNYAMACLSICSSRAAAFAAQQLLKLAGCAAILAAYGASGRLLGAGGVSPGLLLRVFCALLAACGLYELAGLLAHRYGRWAPLICSVAVAAGCVAIGVSAGYASAAGGLQGAAWPVRWLAGLNGAAALPMLAAAALMAVASWGLFRRAEVR